METKFESLDERCLLSALSVILKKSDSTKNKKLYFAGPWFTAKGRLLYEACKSIYSIVKDRSKYSVFFPETFKSDDPKKCFDADVEEISNCDVLVALVDEKDVGTAWEIGMAYAQGKPIYLMGYDETTFQRKTNLMLAYTGKCFTLSKFAKFLTCGLGHDEFVNVEKNWEVLE